MHYVKLWSNIVTSSLWLQDHDVIRVWIYLLSQADPHGYVDATLPVLAHQCLITTERAEQILNMLNMPDPNSRTPDDDGRRIEIEHHPEWRIKIVNYQKYREKDLSTERTRRYREKLRNAMKREGTHGNGMKHEETDETHETVSETQVEVEVKSKKKKNKYRSNRHADTRLSVENSNAFALDDAFVSPTFHSVSSRFTAFHHDNLSELFDKFWDEYPRKQAKKLSKTVYLRLLKQSKDPESLHSEIMQGVVRMKNTRQWREGYVPNATTFLRQERWNDQPAPDELWSPPPTNNNPQPQPASPSPPDLNQQDFLPPEETNRRLKDLLSSLTKPIT